MILIVKQKFAKLSEPLSFNNVTEDSEVFVNYETEEGYYLVKDDNYVYTPILGDYFKSVDDLVYAIKYGTVKIERDKYIVPSKYNIQKTYESMEQMYEEFPEYLI